MSFLNSLTSNSNKFDKPFPHWELNNPLSEDAINEIIKADIANPNEHKLEYDGTRAIEKIKGRQSNEIEKIIGYASKTEVVHKDDMVKL